MTTHRTHCWLRLGDQFQHMQFLRRLALEYPKHQFEHYFAPQLANSDRFEPVIADCPNIALFSAPAMKAPPDSVDAWKGAENEWYQHPKRLDYAAFYLEFFAKLAARLHLDNPITTARDLLFDYPALGPVPQIPAPAYDVLVVNSAPLSGQWPQFSGTDVDTIVRDLCARGHRVVCTAWSVWGAHPPMTPTEVGRLSQSVRLIVMVSTGPSWPTFNIWTHETLEFRLVLLDKESLHGLALEKPDRYAQARTCAKAREILTAKGWL